MLTFVMSIGDRIKKGKPRKRPKFILSRRFMVILRKHKKTGNITNNCIFIVFDAVQREAIEIADGFKFKAY